MVVCKIQDQFDIIIGNNQKWFENITLRLDKVENGWVIKIWSWDYIELLNNIKYNYF